MSQVLIDQPGERIEWESPREVNGKHLTVHWTVVPLTLAIWDEEFKPFVPLRHPFTSDAAIQAFCDEGGPDQTGDDEAPYEGR